MLFTFRIILDEWFDNFKEDYRNKCNQKQNQQCVDEFFVYQKHDNEYFQHQDRRFDNLLTHYCINEK